MIAANARRPRPAEYGGERCLQKSQNSACLAATFSACGRQPSTTPPAAQTAGRWQARVGPGGQFLCAAGTSCRPPANSSAVGNRLAPPQSTNRDKDARSYGRDG